MARPSLTDPAFDRSVDLRTAYRAMEAFLTGILARGDRPLSEVLHRTVGIATNGESAEPEALADFLAEATFLLEGRRR
jgi:hypothetical protein